FGSLEHRVPDGARQLVDLEQEVHEPDGVVLRERVEEDGGEVALPAAPGGTGLRELRTRRAEEEHGAADPVCELLEEIEERLVRPVDVLDRRDRWPPGPEAGEER